MSLQMNGKHGQSGEGEWGKSGRPTRTLPESVRTVFEFLTVLLCTLAFIASSFSIATSFLGKSSAGTRDFVEYWAAGQQLIHHANPYDGTEIRQLELSAGFPATAPTLYLGNPPSALLLVLPLGFVSPIVGEVLWEIALLLSLALSVNILRSLIGRQQSQLYLILYAFAPVLACLLGGQIALFLLLGLVLFLRFHQQSPFLAGAFLWFCLLKPHLFLPFGVALIAWILYTRNYKVIAGVAASIGASSMFATLMRPGIWSNYQAMMREQRIDQLDLPCVSVFLRQHLYPHAFWVQCLPAFAGCLWGTTYFLRHREHWSWLEHGSLLLLVSVVAAPYSWFMDQTLLIPSLLYALYRAQSRTLAAVFALISALLEIIGVRGASLYSPWYLVAALAWSAWFLVARSHPNRFTTFEA
jgi:hypothetical protein